MQFRQFIAIILMLVLSVGPVLASACTNACAMNDAQVSQRSTNTGSTTNQTAKTATSNSVAMSAEHCSMDADEMGKTDQPPSPSSTANHKYCAMAGCHVVQGSLLMANAFVFFADLAQISRLPVHFFGISADLIPPSKPPA